MIVGENTGRVRARGAAIRRYILQHVQKNPHNIAALAAGRFGVSRQAVNRHLKRLVEEGALRQSGNTRNRVYEMAAVLKWNQTYRIDEHLAEDVVWRREIDTVLGVLTENVRGIWQYGFTEMFNNAMDHSDGSTVTVAITKTAVAVEMLVWDDGVGIFRKIQQQLGLLDERHAILELSKGKLTTDPQHHTGEGIFFASRMFDAFSILSGGVFFTHDIDRDEDWLVEPPTPNAGTAVLMRLDHHATRTPREIFDQFTVDRDEPVFAKTVVPVRLAQYGDDQLISRSQAKRVLARLDLFHTVILDFTVVPTIGQAFADEVFRIFPRDHPRTSIIPINATADVTRMIARARAT